VANKYGFSLVVKDQPSLSARVIPLLWGVDFGLSGFMNQSKSHCD
jgi:hypothetical protein